MHPADLLVGNRGLESDCPCAAVYIDTAVGLQRDLFSSVQSERDLGRTRPRRDLEVEFEPSVLAVVDEVNGGVNFAVAHSPESWNTRSPFAAVAALVVIDHPF
jgi:hypothetical protein